MRAPAADQRHRYDPQPRRRLALRLLTAAHRPLRRRIPNMSQRMRGLLPFVIALVSAAPVRGQTIEDGFMIPAKRLCTGFVYTHDAWDQYWEGTLKRGNGNIGTVTTQNVSWMGNYGLTDRLNVIAMLPYVWTGASQGVLSSMDGVQDVTVAVKYNALHAAFTDAGALRAIVVGTAGTPVTDYVPDFLPLSIGLGSSQLGTRLTAQFLTRRGWFLLGSAAYTWRGKVKLDRPAYYTDGQLYLSDEVAMPDVFDYSFSAGYQTPRLYVPVTFSQQNTLGGGDIRRQDMPFVSNRMNVSQIDGAVHYYLPRPANLSIRVGAAYTVSGRNVGQATSFTAGLLYLFHF
jgi:hypothetical protein